MKRLKHYQYLTAPPDESHLPGELPDCHLWAAHYLVRGGAHAALAVAWRSWWFRWRCCSRVTIPSWEEEDGGAKHPSDTVTIIEIVIKITAVFITDTASQLISTISRALDIYTSAFLRIQTADIYHRTLNSPDAHHKINNNKGNRLFWMHFIPKYMDYYCQHYSFG